MSDNAAFDDVMSRLRAGDAGDRSLPTLAQDAWQRLERLLEAFENAWLRGERPLLEDYLAQAEPAERLGLLRDLVHKDLEYRLKAGETVRMEMYLERYPELGEAPKVVMGLLAAEYALRRQNEPGLRPEEFIQRFPLFLDHFLQWLSDPETAPPVTLPEGHPEAFTLPPATPRDLLGAAYPSIPGYEILDKLGEGGMGVVYKARQLKLDRVVALKMILSGGLARVAELARFQTEAEAIARLQHLNIVQVHEVGEHEGQPFFSLEFCPNGSLDKKLKGTPLPPREAAGLVQTLARAMQAAHDKNVIHRDLKPANVLLAEDGIPKIADFGLAKKLDETGQTQTGAVMGTPSYMAPEQAEGKKEVGPAADVYALGAILYECLTGRPPFKAANSFDTLL
jgi:eukaryotic-like serine/threonine-protein kinase